MRAFWGTENRLRAAVAAVSGLVIFALAACASDARRASTGGVESSSIDEETVEHIAFGEALAQLRGHHIASLELYRAGDFDGATVHAGHPIHELLDSVRGELDEADPRIAGELEDALNEGLQAIRARASAELERIHAQAARITERAERSVVGETAAQSSYRGSVIAALLATAAHEYEEALDGRRIALLAEYQDGYAFAREARRLYEARLAPEVEQESLEEAEEIEEAFDALSAALPSVQPPKRPVALEEVEQPAELIGHELAETVDAFVPTESEPAEVAEEIESLLAEVVDSYRAGQVDRAAELSAEAYLENYEVIEPEVIDRAPEVNEELEPLLGAELRRRMREGAPASEIAEMARRARELLAEAVAALGAQHP